MFINQLKPGEFENRSPVSQGPIIKAVGNQKTLIMKKILISIFRDEFLSITLIDHDEFKNLAIEIVRPMLEGL